MKWKALLVVTLVCRLLSAQVIPARISTLRIMGINYDNDYFSATDRYYTQGVKITLVAPGLYHNPLNQLLPKGKSASINYYGLALQRDGFTPASIRMYEIYYGERPYAGTMFISSFHVSINKAQRYKTSSQLNLGLIGPIVGGREEQTAIHKAINGVIPQGWHNQVANDLVVNYNVKVEKGITRSQHFESVVSADARLGTLYSDIAFGAMMREGFFTSWFSDPAPANRGSGSKWQCYVFAGGSARAVGYNATMQGGMFNRNSVYTLAAAEVSRVVGSFAYGIVLGSNRFNIEYSKVRITPEFKGGLDHGWGHCQVNFCF